MEIKQRLCLYDCDLVRVGVERVDVQFAFTSFKIDVAERLQAADGLIGKSHKYASVAGKAFEVGMALPVKIRAHLFDLEIGHVAHASAERAFVAALAAELKSFDKTSLRKRLIGRIYQLGQAHILCRTHWRRASHWLSR